MDDVDIANQSSDKFLKQALAAQKKAASAQGPGTIDCIDCGDEIPEKRRENMPGCCRCVHCQCLLEKGG